MNQAEIHPGIVNVDRVRRGKEDWLLVSIDRGRYTKRFNLRESEAQQLVAELVKHGH